MEWLRLLRSGDVEMSGRDELQELKEDLVTIKKRYVTSSVG
jgi:hypothetical protein